MKKKIKKKIKKSIDRILLKFGLQRIQENKGESIKYSETKPEKITFQFTFGNQIGYRTHGEMDSHINEMVENQSMQELMKYIKPYVYKEVTNDCIKLEVWVLDGNKINR